MANEVPDTGTDIRRLMRRCQRIALGTLDGSGEPYVSLAMVALDQCGAPLLYLSDLADHTRNLKRDNRVSLLFDGTLQAAVPLAGERVTVQGRISRADDEPRLLARYVACHPDAASYAGFRDFHLYRASVERAHLVAGFGRIHWVDGGSVTLAPAAVAALQEAEAGIVEHMNADHSDAIQLYANRLLGRPGDAWRMIGIDPDGCDLRQGGEIARLGFETIVHDGAGARAVLVAMVRRARSMPAS
jgi:putative heme iron utilization protein